MRRTAVWALAVAAWWAAAPAWAADPAMRACAARAARVAAAVGGSVGQREGEGFDLVVPAGSWAYFGCANGAVGFSVDGKGAGLSGPVAKVIAAAAMAIAGRTDPALRRGAAACLRAATILPEHGKAGLPAARRMRSGQVSVGGLRFNCTYLPDGSERPTFFVGPVP